MMPKSSIALIALLAAGVMVTPAVAHPKLKAASPAVDGVAASSLGEIRLSFNEDVIAKFSSVDVKDQSGQKIPIGKVATDPKDRKQLVVTLASPLTAGHYTVGWIVVSEDTHRVEGSYSFRVDR